MRPEDIQKMLNNPAFAETPPEEHKDLMIKLLGQYLEGDDYGEPATETQEEARIDFSGQAPTENDVLRGIGPGQTPAEGGDLSEYERWRQRALANPPRLTLPNR